jgi:hypothetical protein
MSDFGSLNNAFFPVTSKEKSSIIIVFFILWEYRQLRIFFVLFLLDSTSFNSFWSICLWESYYWFSYTQHNCTSIVILLFIQLLLIFGSIYFWEFEFWILEKLVFIINFYLSLLPLIFINLSRFLMSISTEI